MLPIIPQPNGTTSMGNGTLTLPGEFTVDLGGFHERCLNAFRERTGLRLLPAGGQPLLCLRRDTAYAPEQHSLRVTGQGVEIAAGGERGVIWALTSLYLLMRDGTAPCCTIEGDGPRYAHRGLMLDCARHFFPVEEVRRIVEHISLAKMNVLHWHLSDDQGWRIESRAFPLLHQTENQPYYSQQQIRDVVRFAADRGVEVVPEIDMPGHTTAMLAAYPALSCRQTPVALGRAGGIFPVVLCPGKEEVFNFVSALLDEVAPLFDSPRFHMGGDEVLPGEWRACDDCRRRMGELGISEPAQLQRYFMGRVQQHLRRLGKQPVCWNDTLSAGAVDADVTIQYWVEMTKRRPMIPYLKGGGRAVFSDMFHCYFDYPHGATPLRKAYAYLPGVDGLDASRLPGALGLEACLWTERIETAQQLEQAIFPRIFATAEAAWSHDRDYKNFERRLHAHLPRLRRDGVACTEPSLWNPKGKQRRDQVVDYLSLMFSTSTLDDAEALSEMTNLRAMFKFVREFFRPGDLLHAGRIKKALALKK